MKILSKLLSLTILAGTVVPVTTSEATDGVWDGSADVSWYDKNIAVFEISTPEQLAGLAQLVNEGTTFVDKKVVLVNDIKLNTGEIISDNGVYSFSSDDELNEWKPIGEYVSSSSRGFRGTFDGNNHTIEGLYINNDETDYQGLFGISYGCSVSGINLENSLIITSDALSVGGIIAGVPSGITSGAIEVSECTSDVIITDNNASVSEIMAGGIAGSGHTRIASRNITINISDSEFSGVIDIDSESHTNIAGGIIGKSSKLGTISGCSNTGEIKATNAAGISAVTRDDLVIRYSYNTGDITAVGYAGGIIGDTDAATKVEYCYSTGAISGVSGNGAITANNVSGNEDRYINNVYLAGSAGYAYKAGEETFSDVLGKAVSKTEEEIKSDSVVDLLNEGDSKYILPEDNYNNGYPVIKDVYYKILYKGKYTVSNPVITGEIGLGNKLVLSYDADGDQDALMLVTWQWQISDTQDGIYDDLEEKSNELEITLDIYNKYVKAVLSLPTGEKLETESVLISNADFEGTISNLEVRGLMKAGNTLSYTFESDDVTDAHVISTKWERALSLDGNWMTVGNEKSIKTDVQAEPSYYRVTIVLINGDTYTSEPAEIVGRENFAYDNTTHHDNLVNMRLESDSDYMFSVTQDGVTHNFLLLDAVPTSDTGRFLVYADQTYGLSYTYSELSTSGFPSMLPDAITRHIDYNVYHEGSINAYGQYVQDLYGIGAIGVPELRKYKDIIGAKVYNIDDKDKKYNVTFGTRTNSQRTDSGGYLVSIKGHEDGTVSVYDREYQCDNHLNDRKSDVCKNCVLCDSYSHTQSYGVEIRPLLYLDKDFFKDENIDLDNLGIKAAEIIGANADKESMLERYNRKTLETVFRFSPDFVITSLECKDASDNVLTELPSGDFKIVAKITAKCKEENARLIAAVYDEEGILEAVSSTVFKCNYNGETTTEIPFSGLDTEKELNVKISVLGTDDNLLSVTDAVELF